MPNHVYLNLFRSGAFQAGGGVLATYVSESKRLKRCSGRRRGRDGDGTKAIQVGKIQVSRDYQIDLAGDGGRRNHVVVWVSVYRRGSWRGRPHRPWPHSLRERFQCQASAPELVGELPTLENAFKFCQQEQAAEQPDSILERRVL